LGLGPISNIEAFFCGLKSAASLTNRFLTILFIKPYYDLCFFGACESLDYLGLAGIAGHGTIQKLARAFFLHDLWSPVLKHVAEAIVAEDDGLIGTLGIGDYKLAL